MKKSILIIAIAVISVSNLFAQSKDTVKATPVPVRKEFKLDENKVYQVTLNLNMFQLTALIGTIDGTIKHNPNLKGDQIAAYESEVPFIKRSITDQVTQQQIADYQKFQSDTAATIVSKTLNQ